MHYAYAICFWPHILPVTKINLERLLSFYNHKAMFVVKTVGTKIMLFEQQNKMNNNK